MANFIIDRTSGLGEGTIQVNANAANTGSSRRSGTVTVKTSKETKTVSLVQYGQPTAKLGSGSDTVPAAGGSVTFVVHSDYAYHITSVDSLGLYDYTIDGTAVTKDADILKSGTDQKDVTHTVVFGKNSSENVRTVTFTLTYYTLRNHIAKTLSAVVSQAAGSSSADTLTVSKQTLLLDYTKSSSATVAVTSTNDWTAVINDN